MPVFDPMPPVQNPLPSRVVMPHKPKWHGRLAAALVYLVMRTLALTLRFRWHDQSGLLNGEPSAPAIFCAWHNRLSLSGVIYTGYMQRRQPSRRMAALVSASKDGALLASILEKFGAQPVRGSSSRRGPQAMLELTTWAERGYDLAITPDGPRGPCYHIQRGVMSLAQITGLPIVPVSFGVSRKVRLKSWDGFIVPLPFARCDVQIGEPIRVPREATDDERHVLRQQLEQSLQALTVD